ncbi:S-type pyocin domain-containing protein [Pseudomonas sp. PD9R]|uniref:S-type pyocin domain-containing protein n=1 Tax=Pseudomonas sp. PD9R TaxID=2853534 RepID=UPI001C4925B2|nr:S-type pyocin domain-containing protein [Pseudomonas sp. PD9R]MBV6827297.1 S-type pyocin domain-containing protein [Pseudomonas sp. PD9R]
MNILANQLNDLSTKITLAEPEFNPTKDSSTSIVDEKISAINLETDIRFQLIPSFILENISSAGVTGGLTLSQSLTNYKTTIDNIIASEQSAISSYAKANPAINAPLSKPELEALSNLVNLQAHTNLGKRWQDYHVSLLHSETVRYLTEASNAFSGLIARAQDTERLQEQLRIAAEQSAHRQAQERKQEEIRIEALRLAHRKAAAEKLIKLEKQKSADSLAEQFNEIAKSIKQNIPKEIDQRLIWLKDKQQELLSAHRDAESAERDAGGFYGISNSNNRKKYLRQIQKSVDFSIRVKYQIHNVNLSTVSGPKASVHPLVITPDGLISGYEHLPTSLNGAVESLKKIGTTLTRGPFMLVSTVFYSAPLGNGELQRNPVVMTMPLSLLIDDVSYISSVQHDSNFPLPFRAVSSVQGGHTNLYLAATGEGLSKSVRLRHAQLDAVTNLYTFTTEGILPRTLTWTPDDAPGSDALGSTDLPAKQPGIMIYPGARVTQIEGRTDEHPTCDEADTDDYILVFPAESGFDPVYIMASRSGPRYEPGTATGTGQAVGDNWLGSASEAGGAPVPTQIADQLRGQDFRNFDKFREKFWRAVANDAELNNKLGPLNKAIMKSGYSPYAPRGEQVGGREKFEIHHVHPIGRGGEVYNIDNMAITTPKSHIAEHSKDNGDSL